MTKRQYHPGFDDDVVLEVREAFSEDGRTLAWISRSFGIPKETVEVLVKEAPRPASKKKAKANGKAKKVHPKRKYDDETVQAVREARFDDERSLTWISKKFQIPIDTIRDWIYPLKESAEASATARSKRRVQG